MTIPDPEPAMDANAPAGISIGIRNPEKPNRWLGDLAISMTSGSIVIAYLCNDYFYSFELPIHLGQLLSDLGLTAADCERAIVEWESFNLPPLRTH